MTITPWAANDPYSDFEIRIGSFDIIVIVDSTWGPTNTYYVTADLVEGDKRIRLWQDRSGTYTLARLTIRDIREDVPAWLATYPEVEATLMERML